MVFPTRFTYIFAYFLVFEFCLNAFILQELPLYYNERMGKPRSFSDLGNGDSLHNVKELELGQNEKAYNHPRWNRLHNLWSQNEVSNN